MQPRNLIGSLELCDNSDSLVPEESSVAPCLEIPTAKGKKACYQEGIHSIWAAYTWT